VIIISVKEAMNHYFSLRKRAADEGFDFLLKTPLDEETDSLIYVGEVDEDEYVFWRPVEKEEITAFAAIEERLGTRIHRSVVEYFNSYWFADLDGFTNDYYIRLESIRTQEDVKAFENGLWEYKCNHNNKMEHIPIGMEGNGLIVVVDAQDGSIKFEDHERHSFELLAKDLEQFILSLRLPGGSTYA
jgi:hypothetical protein